jgi:hypothetical protein
MTRCTQVAVSLAGALLLAAAERRQAQETGDVLNTRAPRFLARLTPTPVPVDLGRSPMLTRRIGLRLQSVSLLDALQAVEQASGLRFVYSPNEIKVDRPVWIEAADITVAAALTEIMCCSPSAARPCW